MDKSRFVCNLKNLSPPVHSDDEVDNGDGAGQRRNKANRGRPWARKRRIPPALSVLSKRRKGSGTKAQSKNGAAAAASSEPVQSSTSASSSHVDNAAAAAPDAVAAGLRCHCDCEGATLRDLPPKVRVRQDGSN